jgi:hypothetical protein
MRVAFSLIAGCLLLGGCASKVVAVKPVPVVGPQCTVPPAAFMGALLEKCEEVGSTRCCVYISRNLMEDTIINCGFLVCSASCTSEFKIIISQCAVEPAPDKPGEKTL